MSDRARRRKRRSFVKKNRDNFRACVIALPAIIFIAIIISYFYSNAGSGINKNFYADKEKGYENTFDGKDGKESEEKKMDNFRELATKLFKIKIEEVRQK